MKKVNTYIILTALLTMAMILGGYSNNTLAADKVQNSISITDSKTSQQVTLSDDTKLNRFFYIWSQKQPLRASTKSGFQWRYQLVIVNNNQSSRWVYDPRGFTQPVNLQGSKSTSIYKLSSTRSFNRYLESIMNKGSTK